VTAPVGHDAVVADGFGVVQIAAFTPITDDGIEGNALGRGDRVDGGHKAVPRLEGVDAVRYTLEFVAAEIRLHQANGLSLLAG